MEALSPTMEEGRVVKWHKHEGDAVKTGEVLAEVETDKAVMDLVARADGVLRRVAAAEGQTVAVGSVVAVIAAPGEGAGAGSVAAGGALEGRASGVTSAKVAPSAGRDAAGTAGDGAPVTAVRTPVATAVAAPVPPSTAEAGGQSRVKASPLARRIARDSGVDLKLVAGSGPGGRVVRRDLEGAARAPAQGSPAPTAPPGTVAAVPSAPPAPGRPPEPVRPGTPYEDVSLTQIRKTIAKRLAMSLGPIPHFFLTTEVDMERAAEAREALNHELGEHGKVSFNDIILKATALALRKHRACNAWFQDDHIRYWNEVHLGMAVAVEDGLITPVLRNADLKSLTELGREAKELADRARSRRLQPTEYTGATFSVSNLGMFDIDEFTAVINPPEAGIIAVGSIGVRPTVVEGVLVPRRRMRITMSCDHRVIDGATGAVFLKTLKQMLENPLAMLA